MFLKLSVRSTAYFKQICLMWIAVFGVSISSSAVASESHPHNVPKSVTQAVMSTKPLVSLGGGVQSTDIPVSPSPATPRYTPPKVEHAHESTHPAHSEVHFVLKKGPEIKHDKASQSGAHAKTTHHGKAHWRYSGEAGPEHWGTLSPKFALCQSGKNQSPIDITESHAVGTTKLAKLSVFYHPAILNIVNNGHTIEAIYPAGSYIKIGQHRYDLLQYHLHTPSEHTRNGIHYPLEMHLVHKDRQGNLAVIAIIFKEGKANPYLDKIILNAPVALNAPRLAKGISLSPEKFFPKNKTFFKYSGSLTTPPCSEGVYWTVFKYMAEASAEQIKELNQMLGKNNRPVQQPYARNVLKSYADRNDSNTQYEFY